MESEKYNVEADGVIAKVTIERDPKEFVPLYKLEYPKIEVATQAVLDSIREELITDIEVQPAQVLDPQEIVSLKKTFLKKSLALIEKGLPKISAEKKDILAGILLHHSLGLGSLEILLNDKYLEEIVINNAKEPVWVYHRKLSWLKTNVVVPTDTEVYNFSSMIGRRVGTQITYLSPLMDAYLVSGDRANATLFPISTKGNTLTIRKFASRPWTITDFVELNTISVDMAAFLWLAIQYEMNTLIAGGTASGKTSLLNVLSGFIPPNQRIISIEDSVTGDAEVMIRKGGKTKKLTFDSLFTSLNTHKDFEGTIPLEEIEILTLDKRLKMRWSQPGSLYRHKVSKDVYEVLTSTGRKVCVTKDHSLFTLGADGRLAEVTPAQLTPDSFLATPRVLPDSQKTVKDMDLLKQNPKIKGFVTGDMIGSFLREAKLKELKRFGISKSNLQYWRREAKIPATVLTKLLDAKKMTLTREDKKKLFLTVQGSSHRFPLLFPLTDDLLYLWGLWLGDGSYDRHNKNRVIVSNSDPECIGVIKRVAKRYGIGISRMNDGVSYSLNSTLLYRVMKTVFGFEGHSATKRVPQCVFSLSEKQRARFLCGYFSADGTVKNNEIACSSQSDGLLRDIQTLLLMKGILSRISRYERLDQCKELLISAVENVKTFSDQVGFLQKRKQDRASVLALRKPTHSNSDVIPLQSPMRGRVEQFKNSINPWYFSRWNMGRGHLQGILQGHDYGDDGGLFDLAESDVFWDRVISVRRLPSEERYVYDISVPSHEKFVANNILLHNTREIQIPEFLHWVPLTTRPANPEGKGEVTMLELLVNSLRMRPDRILVGEIRRSREAEVLFEAIHTGHSVYATLHANTAEETVRRLVNPPIDIAETLLSSLHLVAVMHRDRRREIRRVVQVSEITMSDIKTKVDLNTVYSWTPATDKFNERDKSKRVMNDIQFYTGMTGREIQQDLKEKVTILNWLVKKQIKNINKVGEVISTYYINPEKVLEMVKK